MFIDSQTNFQLEAKLHFANISENTINKQLDKVQKEKDIGLELKKNRLSLGFDLQTRALKPYSLTTQPRTLHK